LGVNKVFTAVTVISEGKDTEKMTSKWALRLIYKKKKGNERGRQPTEKDFVVKKNDVGKSVVPPSRVWTSPLEESINWKQGERTSSDVSVHGEGVGKERLWNSRDYGFEGKRGRNGEEIRKNFFWRKGKA